MPANGWWHEAIFNYDVKVENNELYLDIAEREAKILIWYGEDWQPATLESKSMDESPSADNELNHTAQEQ